MLGSGRVFVVRRRRRGWRPGALGSSFRRLLAGLLLAALALPSALIPPALALATPVPIATPFDPRAEGEGPGLVGEPLLAALVVLALGVAAAALTYLYVRLSRTRP